MLDFPLSQRIFKARTWHKARFRQSDDNKFYDIPPEDFVDIRHTLCESSKENAKIYMEDIYKMIIRWCNDEPTLTDSDSSNSSSDTITKNTKNEKKVSTKDDSSLSSCETDMNLSRTKGMDKKKKKKRKKKRKKGGSTTSSHTSSQKKDTPHQIQGTKTIVDDNLDKSVVNHNLTTIDEGIPLDKFYDALHKSSHEYLPTRNNERQSSGFNAPVSPLDRNKFYPGCNSGIQGATGKTPSDQEVYMSGVSQHSVQNRAKAPVTPFLSHTTPLARNANATPRVTFDPTVSTQRGNVTSNQNGQLVRNPSHLLKRQALPQTVKWDGTGDNSFETFLGLVNSHIGQQAHLAYMIIPEFIALWLTIGEIDEVLGLARRMNIHMSLNYITSEQFIYDITWLFSALKQAIGDGRGSEVILRYETSQDGIAAYHTMFNKYYYGGDMQTFMSEMETILNTDLHRGYPGGALQYLNDWEKAAVRLKRVTPNEDWTDSSLRRKFSQRFSVLGWTDTT